MTHRTTADIGIGARVQAAWSAVDPIDARVIISDDETGSIITLVGTLPDLHRVIREATADLVRLDRESQR